MTLPEETTPLDLLLGDAARSPVRRFLPGMSGVRFTANLAKRPGRVAGRTRALAAELAKVGVGRSELAPHEKDRRFSEEGWSRNPFLKRTLQGYLAIGETARGLVKDAELDWGDDQRMGFIVDNLVEASSPSNNPMLNPKVLKRAIDTGGGSLVAGGRRLVRDFATPPRVPSMVEPDAFEVGDAAGPHAAQKADRRRQLGHRLGAREPLLDDRRGAALRFHRADGGGQRERFVQIDPVGRLRRA